MTESPLSTPTSAEGKKPPYQIGPGQLIPGGFLEGPKYIPPVMHKIDCGYCGFKMTTCDLDLLERLYEGHTCDVACEHKVAWHTSFAAVTLVFWRWLVGGALFALFMLLANGWMPWTN